MMKTPKLTDLDLVLLSGAAGRDDGMVLPPPTTVRARGKTLEKALAKLLRHGLVEECKAETPDQAWRQDDGRGIALRITAAGLQAIGLDVPCGESDTNPDQTDRVAAAPKAAWPAAIAPSDLRPGTKQARLVELLVGAKGAGIDVLVSALGWQPHTVRAAITGLRKKGYVITSTKGADGKAIYRAMTPVRAVDDAT